MPLINPYPQMGSSLRGPERAEHDCARCRLRKQTCERKLPLCTRCFANDPLEHSQCRYVPAPTYPVVQARQPEGPLLQFSREQWRFTDHGREQLGKLLFSCPDFFNGVPRDLGKFAKILLSDYGHTIDELLQDNIFKWFPIVEPHYMDKYARSDQSPSSQRDPDRFLPLLHMAILLVTSPPAQVICGGSILDGVPLHTDLYKAIKSLFAVISGVSKTHFHLVQTLGLIALYEFGIGAFEQAHVTLTSAVAMTNLYQDYTLDAEPLLTWKLCLVTLDRMIAMSTHSRLCSTIDDNEPNRLPLICDSDHPLSKEIELLVKNYDRPLYRRNSEEAIQRLLAMNEGLTRAGRILHCNRNKEENLLYDSDCDLDSDIGSNNGSKRNRTDGMEEEKRAVSDDNGNPKAPDY